MRESDPSRASAAGRAVLDRLPYALLVVDDLVRPLVMNARARDAIARGLRLDDAALRFAVAAAASPAASWLSGATALQLSVDGAAVPVLVLPALVDVDPLLGRRGLVFIAFGEADRTPPCGLLESMYGFTRRESDVACALMDGQNVAEAARALGMTIPTARTHLRHLLEKTGTTRQGELLRILLGSSP